MEVAIVAQAAATAATLMPGRFFLGFGTGGNLNEHVLGDRWPSSAERREMLAEAITVMRGLWEGDLYSLALQGPLGQAPSLRGCRADGD